MLAANPHGLQPPPPDITTRTANADKKINVLIAAPSEMNYRALTDTVSRDRSPSFSV